MKTKEKELKAQSWSVYYLTLIVLATAVIGSIYILYSTSLTSPITSREAPVVALDDTIYRLLRKYQGVSYQQVHNIVQCESRWKSDAKSRISTASGYAQFLYNTWYFEVIEQLGWSNLISPFDGERNLEGLIYLLSENEDWRWESSAHCWR